MQQELVDQVRGLFREHPCSKYIQELNLVLSYGLIGLSEMGSDSAHDAAYYTTRITTFLVKLQEIITVSREEMCMGGMTMEDAYKIT